jgi:hypothetical protein
MYFFQPNNRRESDPQIPEDNLSVDTDAAQHIIRVGLKTDIFYTLLMPYQLRELLK